MGGKGEEGCVLGAGVPKSLKRSPREGRPSEYRGAQAPCSCLPEAQRNLEQQQEKDEDVTEWTGMDSHHRETHHKWREMNQAGDA